jgi:hypothetical protein
MHLENHFFGWMGLAAERTVVWRYKEWKGGSRGGRR